MWSVDADVQPKVKLRSLRAPHPINIEVQKADIMIVWIPLHLLRKQRQSIGTHRVGASRSSSFLLAMKKVQKAVRFFL